MFADVQNALFFCIQLCIYRDIISGDSYKKKDFIYTHKWMHVVSTMAYQCSIPFGYTSRPRRLLTQPMAP